jgi:hypothetical protein
MSPLSIKGSRFGIDEAFSGAEVPAVEQGILCREYLLAASSTE